MANDRLKEFGKTLNRLEKGTVFPYYFISGAEEYLRLKAVESILNNIRNAAGSEQITVIKQFGDEAEPEQLELTLVSYSLFAEKNIVIIKNARKLKPSCWNVVWRFIESPAETSILILEDDKFDRRKKEMQAVIRNDRIFDFPALYENELLGWIKSYARKNGFTISNEAAEYLRNSIEPNLLQYVREFEKLKLFIKDKPRVELEDIVDITRSMKTFDIFEFIDALFIGNKRKAFKILNRIFVYNESVPGVIVMIVRQLTIVLKIKLLKHGVKPDNKKLKEVGLTWYIYNKSISHAKLLTLSDIFDLYEAALDADTHLKTGFQSEKMVLTLLVNRIIAAVLKISSGKSIYNRAGNHA